MSAASMFSAAVILAVFSVTHAVNVSVYYESLCPDSVEFIARQLAPHYSEISKYVDLELVPYGKAAHSKTNGVWQFSCQHGPNECKGNKYQSCALSQKAGSETDVSFVNCVMRSRSASHISRTEYCARRYNLDVQKINSCATSAEGDQLLAANGDKTPSIAFVPTVVYDGVFDQQTQEQSLIDFVAVVCSKINETKPSVCDKKELPRINNIWNIF
ncbi:GILT-like protein 1 isoform X2 [Anoplophora glabripennis]|uniref:GILT-like protein 1 isoform X2 n=1 Tax=Anoplophora glabripennis TaxID=217634 RepID=UPI0008756A75|nr:GILT-like protein 1 isoform X2 [Anoplophora glabripennis]